MHDLEENATSRTEAQPSDLPLLDDSFDAEASADGGAPTEEPGGTHLLELWSDRDEIQALPEILRPAEGLVCVASGTVLRSGRLAKSNWLIALTDRRLLCIKGRVEATRKVIEMPISAIRSVDKSGMWRKTLTLDTGYGTLRITGMKSAQATELLEGLSALMRTFRKGAVDDSAVPRAAVPSGEAADVARLEREIAALRERVIALEQGRTV